MKTSTSTLSWVLLALLGLTSAILCMAPPSLGGAIDLFYVGTVYGVSLVVYFVACRGIRSPKRLAALVLVSAVAWQIADFGSFWASPFIPGGTVHHGDAIDIQSPLIAFGGVLGGVALLLPVLLIFKPASVSRSAVFAKAVLGSLLSGVVGAIAWELGPSLGAAIWALLPTAALPMPESYGMAALFLVWQPVIALFVGWATSERRAAVAVQAKETRSKIRAPASRIGGGFTGRAFAAILAGLVILSLTRIIPLRLRLAHRESAGLKRRESRPTDVDLRVAQPMSAEEALILKPIGDYQPGHAVKTGDAVIHDKGFEQPPSFKFYTLYTKTGEPVPQWPLAPKHYISVIIEQYPDSAWAQYFAEYPFNMYNSFDNPKQHAIVVQFNNKVRSSQLVRSPGQTWNPLYYMWPSGNCVITVDHYMADENLEIVGAYVEKYPSSIR